MKWNKAYKGILCDKKMPLILNYRFYKAVVLYGLECWVMNNITEQSVSVAGIRML